MADLEFVKGLIVKAPHEKAPDFVKANISIKVADLKEWLSGRGEDWVNIDVKVSREGKWYAAVSQFKKDETRSSKPVKAADDSEDDIPF